MCLCLFSSTGTGVSGIPPPLWVLPPPFAGVAPNWGADPPDGPGEGAQTHPPTWVCSRASWAVRRCCWWPPACDTCPVSLCPPTSPPSSGAGGGASPLPEPRQGGFPARWAGNHTQHFEFLRKKRKFLKGGKTAVRGFAMEMQGCVPWGWWLLASPLSLLASPQRPLDWVPLGLAGQEQTPRRKQRNKGKQKRTI